MSGATGAAIITSAVIGAGMSMYQTNKQSEAAEAAAREREAAAKKASDEADAINAQNAQIAADTRPDEVTLGEVQYGTTDSANSGGTSEFLIPKSTTSQLGTSSSGRSGLGFAV